MAEASVDVIHRALGVEFDAGNALPQGATAIELAADRISFERQAPASSIVERMLLTFGRGVRKSACDCDRQQEPTLRQSLFQMSDPWMLTSIQEGELLKIALPAEARVATHQVFQRVLARRATDSELKAILAHIENFPDRQQAWTDMNGLLESTVIYCTGEFGRTPEINGGGGRDHWARAMSSLLVGGPLRRSYVYGSTDKYGHEPSDKLYSPLDLGSTLMHSVGIKPDTTLTTVLSLPRGGNCPAHPHRPTNQVEVVEENSRKTQFGLIL